MRETVIWVGVGAVAAVFGGLVGFGVVDAGLVLLTMVLLITVSVVAFRIGSPRDGSWLPQLVLGAYAVKLMGSAVRYAVLVYTYGGSGDAPVYHRNGLRLAEVWSTFTIPTSGLTGSASTQFVQKVTGLLYVPYRPSMLGGFFIFATLAFLGQLLLYTAFRRAEPDGRLKWYAAAVLFLPTLVFWPSSIGKESLMILLIGTGAYAFARLFDGYRLRWVLLLGAALAGTTAIRVHIAVLLVASFSGTILLIRRPAGGGARVRRVVFGAAALLSFVLAVTLAAERFDIDPGGDDLDPFLTELERRTQQGGSAVEGRPVSSLADVPAAIGRVLFRPYPTEAHNAQALLSSLEGVALMALLIWRLPRMIRGLSSLRRRPYLMFSLFFTVGFVVAFSAVFNLGILARQRSQVFPFVLALLVGLGWPPTQPGGHSDRDESSLEKPRSR